MIDSAAEPNKVEAPKTRNVGAQQGLGFILAVIFVAVLTISNLDAVGRSWYQEGSLLPSITCYELFTSIESVLGVESIRLADAWSELANCYAKVPRYRDAIRAKQQAIEMRARMQGETHPAVLIQKAQAAEYQAKNKNFAEADKSLQDLLAISEKIIPAEPISHAYILEAQAKSFILQKRWNAAIQAAKQLLPIDDTLMADSRTSFDGRELLAEIYTRKGEKEEAHKFAAESLALKQKHLSDRFIPLALAHETLGKVLASSDRKEEASGEFNKAMVLLEKEYGSSGERIQYWRARYDHLLKKSADPFSD